MSNVVSWAVKFIYFVLDSVLTDGLWKVVMIVSLNCHAHTQNVATWPYKYVLLSVHLSFLTLYPGGELDF